LEKTGENLFLHKEGSVNMRSIEILRSTYIEPTEMQRVHNIERFVTGLLEVIGETSQITF